LRIRFFYLLLLSACNLRTTYERPPVDISRNWRFEQQPFEAYANVAWWEQFQDPILNDLISIALQNNQNLQVAIARVLQYYDQYRVVAGNLYPQISAEGSIDRLKLSEDVAYQPLTPAIPPTPLLPGFPGSPATPRFNWLYQLYLKFSYEIDFWGKVRNQTAAAWADYQAQVDAERNVVVALVSNVASSYIRLKQLDNQLLISKLTLESRNNSWDIANKRFDAGLISQLDVKQAESDAEAAAVQVTNYERLIPQQEDLISVLLGRPSGPIPRGVLLSDMKLPPAIPAGLPSDLLENRPDILQAEQNMISANAQIGVARAAFFPAFNLTGFGGKKSTSTDNFFNQSASIWDYNLDALQPLFRGGALIYQLKEDEAILREAIHNYQQTILTALQEVNDALIGHQKAQEKLEIQTRQVAALQEYLKLASLRYFNGQNDYLTVLNAENTLFQAQLEEANTEADVFTTLVDLYKALGQGWQVGSGYCIPCSEDMNTCNLETVHKPEDMNPCN